MRVKSLFGAAFLGAFLAPSAHAALSIGELAGFEVGLDGNLQADGYWFDNDVADLNGDAGNDGDDSEFGMRRAEVTLKAKRGAWDWAVGYDFEGEKFIDSYLRWKSGPHSVRVGQFKQLFGYEELSSSRGNDFIAKSLATNLFTTSRRLGVGYGYDAVNWGVGVSLFDRELTRNRQQNNGFSARAYWLPMQTETGFLHLGASLVDADTTDDRGRFSARPGADFATVRLVDTGTLTNADRVRSQGLEAAWVRGPIKLQGEFVRGEIERYATPTASGSDPAVQAWYLSGMWNITGESWTQKQGVLQVVSPANKPRGLWQVGMRLDRADLDDAGVRGGEETNLTLALSWYWQSNFKVSLNYVEVDSERRGISDDPSILETRLQLYW